MIIAIIITNNGLKWIDRCFGSLIKSTTPLKIFAIDNDSSDGTPGIIREKFPEVEVIETGQNIGFGKANNLGLKQALYENFNFAFLLNQDAWIEPDTIEKLISIHKYNPGYGVLSPLHFSGDSVNLDKYFSGYINEFSCPGLMSDAFSGRKLKNVYEINFVNAAIWLISRNVLEMVGGFDPLFFMYGEDVDYLKRVKFHGFKVGICPNVYGYHDRPQTKKEIQDWTVECLFSSRLNSLKDTSRTFPSKSFFVLKYLKLMINSLILGKSDNRHIKVYKKILDSYDVIKNHRELYNHKKPTFLF